MTLFAEPAWLYAGIGATLGIGLFLWWSERRKRRKIRQFAARKLIPKLSESLSMGKVTFQCILVTLVFLLLFTTLARPQWGSQKRKTAPSGIDVLVALDVSRSMLARDVKPNRIERVKIGISNLLDKMKGDRIGLLAFAGSSFLQCPLTLDHSAFRRTLREMKVGVIKRQGTDFARPIEEAKRSFSSKDNDRFLIIISDGEDLEGTGLKKAKEVAKDGVRIYTIGIGNKEGAAIPLDPIGKQARNFLRDINGKQIRSKLDDSNLVAIARATGGKYYPLGPTGEGLIKVVQELQEIGQKKRHALLTEELPIERYQMFLFVAIALLFGECLMGNRRGMKAMGSGLAVLIVLLFSGCFQKDNIRKAEEAHDQKNYSKAAGLYEAELNGTLADAGKADPRLYLNTGLAHLEAGETQKAKQFLEQPLANTFIEPSLQSTILNALGNLHYAEANLALDNQNVSLAKEAWREALSNYEDAIRLDGNDKAKINQAKLNKQLEERIKVLISRVSGIVWRDIDGNGKQNKKEPGLKGKVFWDKNEDGEHNASAEPSVQTDEKGMFGFEWISGSYPVTLAIGCVLEEANSSAEIVLVQIQPAKAHDSPEIIKSRQIQLLKAKHLRVSFPFRAMPRIKGFVWNDADENGNKDTTEKGFSTAKLFLDTNGNDSIDEKEASFNPSKSGTFSAIISPGRHSLRIKTEDENAKITFPIERTKGYNLLVDYETITKGLDFGIHAPESENQESNSQENSQNENSSNNQANTETQNQTESGTEELAQPEPRGTPREVNALYERLLQEVEANAEALDLEGKIEKQVLKGRDY